MAVDLVFSPTPTTIDAVTLDATVSVVHTHDAEVTDHAVERGSNVSDNVRNLPDMVTIEGIISDTPATAAQYQRAAPDLLPPPGAVVANVSGRSSDAYAQLVALKEAGTLLTVVTELRRYQNMVIKTLTVPRNVTVGDALRFTATLKSVRIVENKTVTVTVTQLPRAKKKVKRGAQGTKDAAQVVRDVAASMDTRRTSLAKEGLDNVAGEDFLKSTSLLSGR